MKSLLIRLSAVLVIAFMAFGVTDRAARELLEFERGNPVPQDQQEPTVPAQALPEGQQVFRYETFEDEEFWTDKAKLHEVIQKSVNPMGALKLGLKIDIDAIPADLQVALRGGKVDLGSPATTLALLKLNAVVGIKGTVKTVDGVDSLARVGITCALCHSTTDNAFSLGMGHRQDGWPNRELDVGALISLSPAISAEQKVVYSSWGPGRYDPRYSFDGKSTPLFIPPIYGLAGVRNATFTGDGTISYWNAYVAVTQMHGHGSFSDPRLNIDIKHTPDLVTPKLPALLAYQVSLRAPPPAAGSFDVAGAKRGLLVFNQYCASCHTNATGTDNNEGVLHKPSETGVDGAYAARSATKAHRTTPLRGLWQHAPYFHDGSATTLEAVVERYNKVRNLRLNNDKSADLVQFLKSL